MGWQPWRSSEHRDLAASKPCFLGAFCTALHYWAVSYLRWKLSFAAAIIVAVAAIASIVITITYSKHLAFFVGSFGH